MKTITEAVASSRGSPVVLCDVSPPRGSSPDLIARIAEVNADFLSIAYSPGQSVRIHSMMAGAHLHQSFGRDVVVTLATRDMNRIAIQSLLLGADLMGVRNVVVLRGDGLRSRDHGLVREVYDYTPTALLADISRLNSGIDFRGIRLGSPTSICAGGALDIGKGLDDETALSARKLASGAEFLICQPSFDAQRALRFRIELANAIGDAPLRPIFAGVQIPMAGGVDFGNVPDRIRKDLEAGRSGMDIAKEVAAGLWNSGVRTFYVVPPIFRSGRRGYDEADELVGYIRSGAGAVISGA